MKKIIKMRFLFSHFILKMNQCSQCGKKINNPLQVCTLCQMRLSGKYADFFRRFFALILDNIITVILSLLLIFIFKGFVIIGADKVELAPWVHYLVFLPFFYGALFESSVLQATPGKMLLRIYVCNIQGARLSFGRAFLRQILKTFSYVFFNFGFILALFTKNKQALHDLFAQTIVLKHSN